MLLGRSADKVPRTVLRALTLILGIAALTIVSVVASSSGKSGHLAAVGAKAPAKRGLAPGGVAPGAPADGTSPASKVAAVPNNIKGDVSHLEPGLSTRPGVLWFESFDTPSWTSNFVPSSFYRPENASIVASAYQGDALQVVYPRGGWSTNLANPTGIQLSSRFADLGLPASSDVMYLRYMVRFEPGFEWGTSGHNAGKLAGLEGGTVTAGTGSDGRTGFSTRPVWQNDGKVSFYSYHAGMKDDYGTYSDWNLGGQRYFVPGKWHSIEMAVKLNTPGKADGWLKGWFDGDLAFDDTSWTWRTTSNLMIDRIAFDTFFGGATSNYASPQTQVSDWDNLVLGSQHIGAPGDDR